MLRGRASAIASSGAGDFDPFVDSAHSPDGNRLEEDKLKLTLFVLLVLFFFGKLVSSLLK